MTEAQDIRFDYYKKSCSNTHRVKGREMETEKSRGTESRKKNGTSITFLIFKCNLLNYNLYGLKIYRTKRGCVSVLLHRRTKAALMLLNSYLRPSKV